VPTPSPSAAGAPLSRRTALVALAGVAGAALGGCTTGEAQRPATSRPEQVAAPADPDVTVAAEALSSQREIIELLAATGRRHRRLSAQLSPVTAVHQAHAGLLADAVPKSFSASPTPAVGPAPAGRRVPRSRARALARVVEAEQELATVTKRQAFRAESGAFARILGSMAAAAAQNAAVLTSSEGSRP
jgi:hypothetical protein